MFLVSGCAGGDETESDQTAGPKSIILIVLDTLRADRLGVYGYQRDTTPRLDALARESVVFQTAGAQATQTLLSHHSIFTAKYPLRLIQETTGADLEALAALEDPDSFLVATFRNLKSASLIERLHDKGYTTIAFTDGGWMSRTMGFAPAFDLFDDQGGHLAEILPRLYGWLEKREAPSFLLVHTYDTHCPYPCREPYNSLFCLDHSRHVDLEGLCGKTGLMSMPLTEADRVAISDHYDGGIASADAYVGQLLDKLRQMNIYDESLIIVTSDHGEALGEHGQIGHGGLYLEQLLVPLIIKFPASWRVAPQRIAAPVEMIDLMPTVLEACGIDQPGDLDGHSLLPLIREGKTHEGTVITQLAFREGSQSITNPAKQAILDPGRWLLIQDARNESIQLFDLQKDPKGLVDIADPKINEVARLLDVLSRQDSARLGRPRSVPQATPLTEEELRQLQSIGYVGN